MQTNKFFYSYKFRISIKYKQRLVFIHQYLEDRRLEKYVINGYKKLEGKVEVSGAKNAAVAIIPATLLSRGKCVLQNLPEISDVKICFHILTEMGAEIKLLNRHSALIDTTHVSRPVVPYDLAKRMRASYYFLGALLARFHEANVAMPGGCDFGVRPIDLHLKGFHSLGADYRIDNGMINVKANRLLGTKVTFDVVSVGATINLLLASAAAQGQTIIENAAKEPHIVDLANFLNSIGAEIMGAGTNTIKVRGVQSWHTSEYSVIPDQIEAGTYMFMAAATGGDVLIQNVIPKHLESIIDKLRKMNVQVIEYDDSVRVIANKPLQRVNVTTQPHPGFPTDMQPQMTTLLTLAQGTSIVSEGVWDNRFRYIDELRRMGANISVDGKVAVVEGTGKLNAAPVRALDLRAGAAMVIAALAAEGTTEIENVEHIERGYGDIVSKLKAIGADIKKIHVPDKIEYKKAL